MIGATQLLLILMFKSVGSEFDLAGTVGKIYVNQGYLYVNCEKRSNKK